MAQVLVIDYGMGNLRSIANALRAVGGDVTVSAEPAALARAQRIVLPGVGAFGRSMEELGARGLLDPLRHAIDDGRPTLGVCLGFQLLFERSTEYGLHEGLGVFAGQVDRFEDDSLIVPHMGWNRLDFARDHPVVAGIRSGAFVYFVHSFRPTGVAAQRTLATTPYGDDFVSAVAGGNVVGFQFHPEKSGHVGLQMLENFLSWRPS